MNTIKSKLFFYLSVNTSYLFILTLLSIALLLPIKSIAQTNVNNSIDTDTLWLKSGSPYLVHINLQVYENATLKIEAGTKIIFDSGKNLTVTGKLISNGSSAEPVVFTGAASTQGYWVGLLFNPNKAGHNTGSSLVYTNIEYAGKSNGNIYINDATVDVSNCIISESLTNGVYVYSKGIANISETKFINNKTNAIYHYSAGKVGKLSNLTASGNGIDGVVLNEGYITDSQFWYNCGLPYYVTANSDVYITSKGSLNIEEGCVIMFNSNSGMACEGPLYANGTKEKPILFTGKEKTPGYWYGLRFESVPIPAKNDKQDMASFTINNTSRIEYLNVEYGGGGSDIYKSNIHIENRKAYISHCSVKYSANDGISALNAGGSVIEFCQITNNTNLGVGNYKATSFKNAIIASNNWWGDASGPYNLNCNPLGKGCAVSDYVLINPFSQTPDDNPDLFSPTDAKILTLTPQRWYTPADGINPVYIKIKLVDGAGNPLSGYQTHVTSNIGTVKDGSLTDANGECYARITSKTAGTATINAVVENLNVCDYLRSQNSEITFTSEASTVGDLLSHSASPYMHEDMKISPMPITQGVPSKLSVKMNNPYDKPIWVDATFEIAQFGIGLIFGPIGTVQKFLIEPLQSGIVEVPWTPPISGHYCTKMTYYYTDIETSKTLSSSLSKGSNSGVVIKNWDVKEAKQSKENESDIIKKARDVIGFLTKLPILPKGLNVPSFLFNKLLNWQLTTAEQIGASLQGDENSTGKHKAPTQFGNDAPVNYKRTDVPKKFEPPEVEPGDWYKKITNIITPEEAAALNTYFKSMADVIYYGRAFIITTLRYQAAVDAGDRNWYCIQASAADFYRRGFGKTLIDTGNNLLALLNVIKSEGFPDILITPQYVIDYQTSLTLTGFSEQDKEAAHNCGLTDEMLDKILISQLAIDPNSMSGSLYKWIEDVANSLGYLGSFYYGSLFPSGQITGNKINKSLYSDEDTTNNLVRIYGSEMDFYVGNPLNYETVITLNLRNIDIPDDWTVSINPKSVTLKPGEQIKATIKVSAGTASVQGTTPRIAVEGFAAGKLIGGVVMDIAIPEKRQFPLPPILWLTH